MFERETARERNLEKAAKEAKNKARKEAGKAGEPEKALTDADLQQVRLMAVDGDQISLQKMIASTPKQVCQQDFPSSVPGD